MPAGVLVLWIAGRPRSLHNQRILFRRRTGRRISFLPITVGLWGCRRGFSEAATHNTGTPRPEKPLPGDKTPRCRGGYVRHARYSEDHSIDVPCRPCLAPWPPSINVTVERLFGELSSRNMSRTSPTMSTEAAITPAAAERLGAQPMTNGVAKPLAASAPTEDDSTIQTVDELVRRRARTHAHHVVVSYPSSGIEYVDYTMQQLDVFAYRVASVYQPHVPARVAPAEKPKVVAILGPSNLDYLVTILALTKLGHTVLFLSTRITQEAVDNLLVSTGASFLFYDPKFESIAVAAKDAIPGVGAAEIAKGAAYNFPVKAYADTNLTSSLDPAIETTHDVFIVHSSGTPTPRSPPLLLDISY